MIYANAIRHCCSAFCSPATCCGLLLLFLSSCHKPKIEPPDETINEVPLSRGINPAKKINGYLYVGLGPINNQGSSFTSLAAFNDPALEFKRSVNVDYGTPSYSDYGNLHMGSLYLGDLPIMSYGSNYSFYANPKSDSVAAAATKLHWKVSGNQAFKPFEADLGKFPVITLSKATSTVNVTKDLRVKCSELARDYDSLFVTITGYGGNVQRKAAAKDTVMNFSHYELEPIRQFSSTGTIKIYASKFYYLVRENKNYSFEVARKFQQTINLTQ